MNSWSEAYRKSWCEMIRAYLRFNIASAKEVEVLDWNKILITAKDSKVDITDYTGSSENYIFLNPSNGRMVIETRGVQKIYKFEVELQNENNK